MIERTESTSSVRFVPFEDAYADGFEEARTQEARHGCSRGADRLAPRLTVEDAIDDVIRYERMMTGDVLAEHGDHEEELTAPESVSG